MKTPDHTLHSRHASRCLASALAALASAAFVSSVFATDYDYKDTTNWVSWDSGTRWVVNDGSPGSTKVSPPLNNATDNFYYNWQLDNHYVGSIATGIAFGTNTMNNLYIDTSQSSTNKEFYGTSADALLTVAGTLYVRSTNTAGRTLFFRGETNGKTPSLFLGNIQLDSTTSSTMQVIFGYANKAVNNVTVTGKTTINNGLLRFRDFIGTVSLGEVEMTEANSALWLADTAVSTAVDHTIELSGLQSTGSSGTVQVSGGALTAEQSMNGTLAITTNTGKSYSYGGKIVHGTTGEGTSSLSVVKDGAGVQKLTGDLNTYTGGTTIDGGILLASNTSSSASATGTGAVEVNTGGTLGGTGFVGGAVTVANGATLSPGDGAIVGDSFVSDAGTLTINNALTLANEAKLTFNLAPVGGDLVQVNGNISLGESVTLTALTSGMLADGIYTLFNYTGTLAGTANLSSWSVTGLALAANQSATFGSNANTVYLELNTTIIPEPATWGAVIGVFALLAACAFRRHL